MQRTVGHLIAMASRGRSISNSRPRLRQTGFTLIEVLISVLILGIGMLGVAAMQATALRNNQSALQRSQAVIQTYTILDAMRANRNAAVLGQYNESKLCTAPTGNSLIDVSKKVWIDSLKQALGDFETTCGSISCKDANCLITVYWDDSRAKGLAGSGSAAQTVATRAQL